MLYDTAYHIVAAYKSSLPYEHSSIKLLTEDGILFLQWDDVAYIHIIFK